MYLRSVCALENTGVVSCVVFPPVRCPCPQGCLYTLIGLEKWRDIARWRTGITSATAAQSRRRSCYSTMAKGSCCLVKFICADDTGGVCGLANRQVDALSDFEKWRVTGVRA